VVLRDGTSDYHAALRSYRGRTNDGQAISSRFPFGRICLCQDGTAGPLHAWAARERGAGGNGNHLGCRRANYHVIKGADQFAALLVSGESVPVRVIGAAPNYDLAVLQLERTNVPLHPIAVGKSSDVQVGQSAFAIGTPYGLEQTLTSGIVSALHRQIPTAEGREIAGGIQTDAPLNPGNSGGPLLDSSGRLIGVTTMIISGSGASAGVGIAIPVDIVNSIAAQLISKGHVATPGIGIAAAPETAAAQAGIEGVIVLKIYPESPAEKRALGA
jgi:2-alkenal reductase